MSSIAALTSPGILSELLSLDVVSVTVAPLAGIGYSNAQLSRVTVDAGNGASQSLVLKHATLSTDWIARRTGDASGREGRLLADANLAAIWDVFACPYLAWATGADAVGLLLADLTPHLLPDVRAPIDDDQEHRLLDCLARLHATFWNHSALSVPGLMPLDSFCDLLAPSVIDDPAVIARLPPQMRDGVPDGWKLALKGVSARAAAQLSRPAVEVARDWSDLPRTLVHGDVKIANFAMHVDGRVWAFDWAIAGVGPCAIDLGWYLAVNASRLAASKERVLERYRGLLDASRGVPMPAELWRQLCDLAVIVGARMLLWSKALAREAGRQGAAEEWDWWADRLDECAARI